MRIFDTIEDVKQYFIEESSRAASQVLKLERMERATTRARQQIQTTNLVEARTRRDTYRDAAQALDDVRPGLIDAFERGEVKLVPHDDEEQATAHWIYYTNPSTSTVHLAVFDDVARYVMGGAPQPLTLCGQAIADRLTDGDETLSGTVATCRRCRKAAGK